ncbi:MAG: ABC transporter permease [Pseudomonadota bacterium]
MSSQLAPSASTPVGEPTAQIDGDLVTLQPVRQRGFGDGLREMINVMGAVILRDIRSRYFNHGLGFLLVPMWPFVHMTVLMVIYAAMGRGTPYGDDSFVFFATGLLPTLMYLYTSRFMATSMLENKPMLSFPIVRLLDIVLARAFLEILAALMSCLLVFVALLALGSDPYPYDAFEAVMAFVVTAIFAVGSGLLVSCIVLRMPMFSLIWAFICIMFYLASGAIFLTADLPQEVGRIAALNPLMHSVDWMRSAFYPGYPTPYLDKGYLIACSVFVIFLGLLAERNLRALLLRD